jgi:hypothetical protein
MKEKFNKCKIEKKKKKPIERNIEIETFFALSMAKMVYGFW